MADHFLGKLKVSADDFVAAGGRPVLEQYPALRALLAEKAGPEAAALFAEPLISRGNDTAPPTVAWYGERGGEARVLESLPEAERAAAGRWLADHLRPVRALAEAPGTADLALGALTTFGAGDVLVVEGRPVIVNWGLMPGGQGANAAARPGHYATALGRFLPLAGGPGGSPAAPPDHLPPDHAPPDHHPPRPMAAGASRPAAEPPAPPPPGRRVPPIAWVPLLVLLLLAGGVLAWLLMPGTRIFHAATPPAVTDAALLEAARAETAALEARRAQLETALAGAVCRADGQLVLPDGRTPEGLLPPAPGQTPPARAEAAPDALLPARPGQVHLPGGSAEDPATLLAALQARTVMVLASGAGGTATGSGLVIAPGRIVTNHHVIEAAAAPGGQILVAGGALTAPRPATLLKSAGPLLDTGQDLALLAIEDAALPAFALHVADTPLALTNVVAAGYPGDVLETDAGFARLRGGDVSAVPGLVVTDGIVNTEQTLGPATRVLMHSAALSSGNSGGPLTDMCGRLLGVNTFVRKGPMQNRGFALSGQGLLAFLDGTGVVPERADGPCTPTIARPMPATAPAGE